MPLKIKKLKSALAKAGFEARSGKGSHTVWRHPDYPEVEVTMAGKDGDDAHKYQLKEVENALRRVGKTL